MKRNELLDRPITFHRAFTRLTKSTTASLVLSFACGLPAGEKYADGWFCLTLGAITARRSPLPPRPSSQGWRAVG